MPAATSTRLIPWAPLVRLLYLAAGVWMIIETGHWSLSLAVPLLLCFLPALLHLTLSLPRWQPLIAERPYVLRWIYGLPVLAVLAWLSAWTIPPVMGAATATIWTSCWRASTMKPPPGDGTPSPCWGWVWRRSY